MSPPDEPRFVVITGTDTGVGKTLVGCGLGLGLARRGRRVIALKPVESGCGSSPGATPEDGKLLARATGQPEPLAALVRLRTPVAPPVAADREGVSLDHREWCERIRAFGMGREIVLVEAAGGLLSPLTWRASARDLALELGAEALVVAADRLGTLNHTLLTLEALRGAGVPILGVVLSTPDPADASSGTNADALRRMTGLERIVVLPRVADQEEAADRLAPVARWLED